MSTGPFLPFLQRNCGACSPENSSFETARLRRQTIVKISRLRGSKPPRRGNYGIDKTGAFGPEYVSDAIFFPRFPGETGKTSVRGLPAGVMTYRG